MPIDPHLAGLLQAMAAAPPLSQGTPQEARAGFRAMTVDLRDPASLPATDVADITIPGPAGDLAARTYRPVAATQALPLVVFFHGGGWVIGDLDTHDLTCRTIANGADSMVLSVDYRLAPEHPFPAAYDDAVAATTWANDHLEDLGATTLSVAGDSAGGNLAAAAAQVMVARGVPMAGQLLLYPATDSTTEWGSYAENGEGYFLDLDTMSWFAEAYVADLEDRADPRFSPAHGSLADLPAAVVVTAEFDPIRDEGVAYAEALAAAGVPVQSTTYPGLIHGFIDMGAFSPAAQAAIDETVATFRTVLHPA